MCLKPWWVQCGVWALDVGVSVDTSRGVTASIANYARAAVRGGGKLFGKRFFRSRDLMVLRRNWPRIR